MAGFRARQVARIQKAVEIARQAVRDHGTADPLVFARAFVEAGGAQVPGDDSTAASEDLGRRLLAALAQSSRDGDADLVRELARAHTEAQWAMALDDDRIVGFLLDVPETALEKPSVEALAHQSFGLGPGVVRKADVIVLQPDCDGTRFIALTEHDIEC